jgi:CBS domain containing-hemolysin-like protein
MIPLALFLLGVLAIGVGTVQAAFSALMRLSLRLLAERSGRSARLGRYLDDPMLLFVPARLLLSVINAFAAVLLARIIPIEGPHSIVFLVLAIVGFVLGCEQAMPLLLVHRDPERTLELALPVFDALVRPIEPITMMLISVFSRARRDRTVAAAATDAPEETGEAAQVFLEAGQQEGLIQQEERRLLQSIVDFGDTLVREVMTPRPDIVAIRVDATLEELRTLFREQEYSRIPVYRENLDNIVGFVFVKDLIQLTETPGDERPITTLMRAAYFVPETKKVSDLLREFQRGRIQSAIVVDEYGGTAGLVTIEDLLEEIVGEIRDEYDVESEPIVDEGNGSFVFSGKVDIDEVAERLDVKIEREGFETVGGFLLSRLGRVPAVGESFEIDGLTVQVVEAERRRINKIRIRRTQPVAAAEGRVETEHAT